LGAVVTEPRKSLPPPPWPKMNAGLFHVKQRESVPSPSRRRDSPPPCGEGLGVGVLSRRWAYWGAFNQQRSARGLTPPPTPPRRRVEDAPSARWEGSPVGDRASGSIP